MKEIDFESLKDELAGEIGRAREIVLSTSSDDHVTSRTVYFFPEGLTVYFITSRAYTKYKQIVRNPKVALCRDTIQIEGRAEILGHPSSVDFKVVNKDIGEYISHYSKYKNTVMIKIIPLKITRYRGNGVYDYLDCEMCKAARKGRGR